MPDIHNSTRRDDTEEQEIPLFSPSLETSHFAMFAVKRISALVSGGGTVNHLTGSLVTNWCILETMVSLVLLCHLSFLSCKSFGMDVTPWASLTSADFLNMDLCNILMLEMLLHDHHWYSLIWFAPEYTCYWSYAIHVLSNSVFTSSPAQYGMYGMHELYHWHPAPSWLCINVNVNPCHLHTDLVNMMFALLCVALTTVLWHRFWAQQGT